jgi:hypothetical protein
MKVLIISHTEPNLNACILGGKALKNEVLDITNAEMTMAQCKSMLLVVTHS